VAFCMVRGVAGYMVVVVVMYVQELLGSVYA